MTASDGLGWTPPQGLGHREAPSVHGAEDHRPQGAQQREDMWVWVGGLLDEAPPCLGPVSCWDNLAGPGRGGVSQPKRI